jgi:hypothetical protein
MGQQPEVCELHREQSEPVHPEDSAAICGHAGQRKFEHAPAAVSSGRPASLSPLPPELKMKSKQTGDILRSLVFLLVFGALRYAFSETPFRWYDLLAIILAGVLFYGLQIWKRSRRQHSAKGPE